jgi:hypothetical protein
LLTANDEEENAAPVTLAVPPWTAYKAKARRGTVNDVGVKVLRKKSKSRKVRQDLFKLTSTTHKEHDPDVFVPFANEPRATR